MTMGFWTKLAEGDAAAVNAFIGRAKVDVSMVFESDTAEAVATLYRDRRADYLQMRTRLKKEAPEVRVKALDEFVREIVAGRRDRFGQGGGYMSPDRMMR
jgi:hypothetical protein